MKLVIDNGSLYLDGLFFCYVKEGNGRSDIPNGTHTVTTTYSHKFGQNLPNAVGLGWLGTHPDCDVVLGRVRSGSGILPCSSHLSRLLAVLETAEDRGQTVELVVDHG